MIVDSGSLEENEDNKGTKMDKLSTAIADMQKSGIIIALPDINEASFGFAPDVNNNTIIFSLKAISGVGEDAARAIIQNRPYASMEDFYQRMVETRIVKPVMMMQLIKAGAFVKLDQSDRSKTMRDYISKYIVKTMDKLTMTHLKKLIQFNLVNENRIRELARIPAFVDYVIQERNVKKSITTTTTKRKLPKCGYYDRWLKLDDISQNFFRQMYSDKSIVGVSGEHYLVSEKAFLKESEVLKNELSSWFNSPNVLAAYNSLTVETYYNEKVPGNEAQWEMNALGYYFGKHELQDVDEDQYGIENFFEMPEEPVPYDYYSRWVGGIKTWMPKNRITRIAGTVVGSNNDKHFVVLLTKYGIVNVKFSKGHYVFYNQKISVTNAEGSSKKEKTVLEESWFKRGSKIIVCGYRNGFNFRAYRYSDTIYTHVVSLIEEINSDGTLQLKVEREHHE